MDQANCRMKVDADPQNEFAYEGNTYVLTRSLPKAVAE